MEIERKYMLKPSVANYLKGLGSLPYRRIEQVYLVNDSSQEVRLRKVSDCEYFITYKKGDGLVREEIEFRLHGNEAEKAYDTMEAAERKISKIRYYIGRWEIDVFKGPLEGLFMLEVELSSKTEKVEFPDGLEGYIELEATDFKTCRSKHLVNIPDLKTFLFEYNAEVLKKF